MAVRYVSQQGCILDHPITRTPAKYDVQYINFRLNASVQTSINPPISSGETIGSCSLLSTRSCLWLGCTCRGPQNWL
jgi:hypothetical protein